MKGEVLLLHSHAVQITRSMGSVVKGMDRAMASMNLEQVPKSLYCSPAIVTVSCRLQE